MTSGSGIMERDATYDFLICAAAPVAYTPMGASPVVPVTYSVPPTRTAAGMWVAKNDSHPAPTMASRSGRVCSFSTMAPPFAYLLLATGLFPTGSRYSRCRQVEASRDFFSDLMVRCRSPRPMRPTMGFITRKAPNSVDSATWWTMVTSGVGSRS